MPLIFFAGLLRVVMHIKLNVHYEFSREAQGRIRVKRNS